jgi:hypothetical protein
LAVCCRCCVASLLSSRISSTSTTACGEFQWLCKNWMFALHFPIMV